MTQVTFLTNFAGYIQLAETQHMIKPQAINEQQVINEQQTKTMDVQQTMSVQQTMGVQQTNLAALLTTTKTNIETFLDQVLPSQNIGHNQLNAAMRYAVMNGGKRIRPALVYATAHCLNIPMEQLTAAAASLELIHCYSLIHDDLPAMDNDDLRRGQPTCHKAFDEATAILAGDALQTMAFTILSDAQLNPFSAEIRIAMVQILANAAGANGMVLGQAEDIYAERGATPSINHRVGYNHAHNIGLAELTMIHQNKTGALLTAAIKLALCANNANSETSARLCNYASNIGLAFQVFDDILDVTTSTEILGKPAGSDQKLGKATFPALLGLDQAQQYAESCYNQALDELAPFDHRADLLRDIAYFFINRRY